MNSGTPPVTANVTIVRPEIMTRITPTTTWWMCRPPAFFDTEMLRGCHHLRGASLSACLRMYRTMVRVTKNVAMNDSRQHSNGRRSGVRKSNWIVACTHKTYADQRVSRPGYPPTRRCAPIPWWTR